MLLVLINTVCTLKAVDPFRSLSLLMEIPRCTNKSNVSPSPSSTHASSPSSGPPECYPVTLNENGFHPPYIALVAEWQRVRLRVRMVKVRLSLWAIF